MSLELVLLAVVAAAGWGSAIALFFTKRVTSTYLSQPEALTRRVTFLRKEGLNMLEESARSLYQGLPATSAFWSAESERMFAEADRLDPPVPPGGEPGRLSLVVDNDERRKK